MKDFATDVYAGVPICKFGTDKKARQFKEGVPGPGRYDELRNLATGSCSTKTAPRFSMPARRKDHVSIERKLWGSGVPGSDTYNPSDKYSKKNGPLFSVSKGRRDGELAIFKNVPGAGTYHPDGGINMVKCRSASWSLGS